MTSFAKATFDVAGYLASRPTYPPRLFDIITSFHARGFVALALAPHFKQITALDPSSGMISKGLQPSDPALPRVQYRVGNAEHLDDPNAGIGAGEDGVDLVVAGQAAHWFDYPKVWKQLTRSVRPGGTVAFIGYAEMVFPNHDSLNPLISHHARHPSALGPHWQPGRRIVEALLDPVPFPTRPDPNTELVGSLPPLTPGQGAPTLSFVSEPVLATPPGIGLEFDADEWDRTTAVRLKSDSDSPWLMRKTFKMDQLETYFRSFSALHEYHEKHPEDRAKKGRGAEGDIVDRLMGKVVQGLEADGPRGDEEQGEVEVGWPLVLMMIKKRA
ncbi:hypothetical protein EHS25_003527 [Saitozyma podzolica]|uniref:Methyltransferase type 11 domain-containing protein n=1 Tax=Saitozyma podzolica TaxID=1890683 RepID=A0A427Y7H9_9TREE|nr:hypothetical protein EHS25_003527 [Saitozyma podzolica]